MSMIYMVDAFKVTVGNPTRKLILIKLADNANDEGKCWPSYKHIADHCEISTRCAMQHVKALEEQGYISVIRRKSPSNANRNRSNLYQLHICDRHPANLEKSSVNVSSDSQVDSAGGGEEYSLGVANEDNQVSETPSLESGEQSSQGIYHSFESTNEPTVESLSSSADVWSPSKKVMDHLIQHAHLDPDWVESPLTHLEFFMYWTQKVNPPLPVADLDHKFMRNAERSYWENELYRARRDEKIKAYANG